jgi:hypothetical protein
LAATLQLTIVSCNVAVILDLAGTQPAARRWSIPFGPGGQGVVQGSWIAGRACRFISFLPKETEKTKTENQRLEAAGIRTPESGAPQRMLPRTRVDAASLLRQNGLREHRKT